VKKADGLWHNIKQATTNDPGRTSLIEQDMTGIADGPMTPAEFQQALGGTDNNSANFARASVITDGARRAIRITIPANTIGTASGIVQVLPLAARAPSIRCSYDIRFGAGFEWSLGGKTPGPSGVALTDSAGNPVPAGLPAGGQADPEHLGVSGRLMWKRYQVATNPPTICTYSYHVGQADTFGDNEWWRTTPQSTPNVGMVAGQWHSYVGDFTLNTVGQANGLLKATLDGAVVLNETAYTFRDNPGVLWSHLMFSIFRGGNTASWAAASVGTIDIANLVVTTL
jgi:hypothetical protein